MIPEFRLNHKVAEGCYDAVVARRLPSGEVQLHVTCTRQRMGMRRPHTAITTPVIPEDQVPAMMAALGTPRGGAVYELPGRFPVDTRPEVVQRLAEALKTGQWHDTMLHQVAATLAYLMAERDGTLKTTTATVTSPEG